MKMKTAKSSHIITSLEHVVRAVQDSARSDAEAVAVLLRILSAGRVAFVRPPHGLGRLAA